MPCRSDYMEVQISGSTGALLEKHRQEIDKLTRIACEALSILDRLKAGGIINGYVVLPETSDWWNAHKEFDKKEGR